LGYRVPWLSLELVAGHFDSCDAFDRRDTAQLYAFQGRVKF